MTLAKIIDTLKMIALKHPNVNSAYEGNIYDILNAKPDNRYASVVITQQSHTTDEIYDHYGFVIFYVDRLVDDLEENRVQIQSIGKSMLGNIITAFCNEFEAECDNILYQPFTQRFTDETAGVYCTITIDTVKDVYCAERYWDESWSAPVVSIKNMDMSITITENGHYVLDYDPTIYTGIGKVDIEVNVPDLNGSYQDGYNQGYAEGEQVSYSNGYDDGKQSVAVDARVLDVTANGRYLTEFSEPYIPSTQLTGDDFYSYATLKGLVYNIGIIPNENTRLEFWYKNDGSYTTYNNIIGSQQGGVTDGIFKIIEWGTNQYRLEYDSFSCTFTMDEGWHHIVVSKSEGLVVDDVVQADLSNVTFKNTNTPFYINSNFYEDRRADGSFGMIKVDDNVIIPTKRGFYNKTTDEYLSIIKNGEYEYVDLQPTYGEGSLYKTVNVNVIPTIDVGTTGLKFAYSVFKDIPVWADFDGVSDMSYMFYACSNLQTISHIDTSNVANMRYMFCACSSLKTIPSFDTSNVTNMESMFSDCTSLQTIPYIDTSNVENMYQMFYNFGGIKTLVSLPKFECGKVGNIGRYFSYYADGMSSLTDVGGWENLKCDWNDNYGLKCCPNLTYQSCINILNGLYDFVGNGENTTRTLKVNPNFLTTVGDEISIGVQKGWVISA